MAMKKRPLRKPTLRKPLVLTVDELRWLDDVVTARIEGIASVWWQNARQRRRQLAFLRRLQKKLWSV